MSLILHCICDGLSFNVFSLHIVRGLCLFFWVIEFIIMID